MNKLQAVIERLKITKAPFCIHLSCAPFDTNYFLVTSLVGGIQYAVYKKQDIGFVIVAFFSNPNQASKEATDIFNNNPTLSAAINYQIEFHKHDNMGEAE